MANKIIRMTKIRQIFRLYAQGESKRKISTLTGVARNKLRKYLKLYIKERLTIDMLQGMSDHQLVLLFNHRDEPVKDSRLAVLHALLPQYEKELKRKGVTMTLLWKR